MSLRVSLITALLGAVFGFFMAFDGSNQLNVAIFAASFLFVTIMLASKSHWWKQTMSSKH